MSHLATSFDNISTSATGTICLLFKKNQILMNYLATMQIRKQNLKLPSCWHIFDSIMETRAEADV